MLDHFVQFKTVKCHAVDAEADLPEIRPEVSVEHRSTGSAVERGVAVPDQARRRALSRSPQCLVHVGSLSYDVPVLPNPPVPRAVSSKVSTTSKSTRT